MISEVRLCNSMGRRGSWRFFILCMSSHSSCGMLRCAWCALSELKHSLSWSQWHWLSSSPGSSWSCTQFHQDSQECGGSKSVAFPISFGWMLNREETMSDVRSRWMWSMPNKMAHRLWRIIATGLARSMYPLENLRDCRVQAQVLLANEASKNYESRPLTCVATIATKRNVMHDVRTYCIRFIVRYRCIHSSLKVCTYCPKFESSWSLHP